jgi:hypothetical protein
MTVTLKFKGSAASGWYAPPKGTHSGEKHRSVGSGKSAAKVTVKPSSPGAEAIPKQNKETLWAAEDAALLRLSRTLPESDISRGALRGAAKVMEDNIAKEMEDVEISVMVPSSTVESIISDGRLKNQYETGVSGGRLDPEFRMEAEKNAWEIEGTSPQSFPIYGVVKSNSFNPSSTEYYGDAELVLKSSIKSRTTYTIGDSLVGFSHAKLVASPIGTSSVSSIDTSSAMNVFKGNWTGFWLGSYIEAQVHGGVAMQDIDKLVIRRAGLPSQQRAIAAAEKANIPWEYSTND